MKKYLTLTISAVTLVVFAATPALAQTQGPKTGGAVGPQTVGPKTPVKKSKAFITCSDHKDLLKALPGYIDVWQNDYLDAPDAAELATYPQVKIVDLKNNNPQILSTYHKVHTYNGKGKLVTTKNGRNYGLVVRYHRGSIAQLRESQKLPGILPTFEYGRSIGEYEGKVNDLARAADPAVNLDSIKRDVGGYASQASGVNCDTKAGQKKIGQLIKQRSNTLGLLNKVTKNADSKAKKASDAYNAVKKNYTSVVNNQIVR